MTKLTLLKINPTSNRAWSNERDQLGHHSPILGNLSKPLTRRERLARNSQAQARYAAAVVRWEADNHKQS